MPKTNHWKGKWDYMTGLDQSRCTEANPYSMWPCEKAMWKMVDAGLLQGSGVRVGISLSGSRRKMVVEPSGRRHVGCCCRGISVPVMAEWTGCILLRPNKLQIYIWVDATLKEMTSKEVYPEPRKRGIYFNFVIVFTDLKRPGHQVKKIGSVMSSRKGTYDSWSCSQSQKFKIGGYLDIAKTLPNQAPPPSGHMRPYNILFTISWIYFSVMINIIIIILYD